MFPKSRMIKGPIIIQGQNIRKSMNASSPTLIMIPPAHSNHDPGLGRYKRRHIIKPNLSCTTSFKEYYIWTFPFANHLKITIINYTSMKKLLEDYILFEEHSHHTPTID